MPVPATSCQAFDIFEREENMKIILPFKPGFIMPPILRVFCHTVALGLTSLLAACTVYGNPVPGQSAIPRAQACDHRFGADATWSHSTDTADAGTFFYAEACAFRFNLAVDVFDSPFRFSHPWMPLPEKQGASGNGRISFEIYFQVDRWHVPVGGESFPKIPDYDATQWSQAAVDAGFHVKPGESKRSRFPNHGQQLYDISGGRYGFDVKTGRAGSVDVLTPLIRYQRQWIQDSYGRAASVAAYKGGKNEEGAAYGMMPFFLGARGGIADGCLAYGRSRQTERYLGSSTPCELTPQQASSLSLSTRTGDMNLSRDEVLRQSTQLLREAIRTGGWYTDFIHWHNHLGLSDPATRMTLHDFFAAQRAAMAGANVVTLGYGEALQHKFLRDMASVTVDGGPDKLAVHVAYRDPYRSLPLDRFRIPLSVRVDLAGTPWAGRDIVSPDAEGIHKLSTDVFVVEVPFHQKEETVTVRLFTAKTSPDYLDFGLPSIVSVSGEPGTWRIVTDKPTRLVLFAAPPGGDLRRVVPLGRSNTLGCRHVVVPGDTAAKHEGSDLYIGAITGTGQSILCGPGRKQPGTEGNWTFPQGPDGRVDIRSEQKDKP